ncbi:MAG TPA: nitroreductase family protein [bacterium]|nr:nitroreductase family protein [bacterium]
MPRNFCCDILPEVKERWSMRALSPEPLPNYDITAICEAARYAPSCFNEQPWRFMVATAVSDLEQFRGFLTPKNNRWAGVAPTLLLILAKRTFAHNGKPNRWAPFDTGTAWGYLTLEAWRRGIVAHGMGGFDAEKVRNELKIPDDIEIIAMAALGYPGDAAQLADEFRDGEKPGERRPQADTMLKPDHFMR